MARLAGSSRLLRAINEVAALAHLLESGPLTRADLRELTGLSKPTTSEVLRRLTDAGLAAVVGRTSGGPGPNAEVYSANPDAAFAAAVSVRESGAAQPGLAVGVCDLTGELRIRTEVRVDFRATDPVTAVTDAVADACRQGDIPPELVGHVQLGVPGSYDEHSDTIHHVDVPGWHRPGLIGDLRARLAGTVGVDNDVNLAAIAERTRGVAAAEGGFALLWLGEGLGLAIDLGGTLLRGARGGAGEIGYMPVGLAGPDGQRDLQDLIGGGAVVALAKEHGIRARSAAAVVAKAAAAIRDDDADREGAQRFLAAFAERVAFGLAAVVAVLDPPLVVLAGDVAQAGGQPLRDAVAAAAATATSLETSVAVTAVADDAVLLGALDAGLVAVRDALFASLQHAANPPAATARAAGA